MKKIFILTILLFCSNLLALSRADIESALNEGKMQLQQLNQHVDSPKGAILFISFSMPDSLILQMSEQASHYKIPVVIRGLVNNQFPDTLRKFLQLQKLAKKMHQHFPGIEIDPIWFEQFNIKTVPALVVTKHINQCPANEDCAPNQFDVVYGNISINNALHLIAKNGVSANIVAKTLLENYDDK